MKFAHMADVHLGAWREPKLKDLSMKSFEDAIGMCIEEEVDFILIAGDLFHTAIPSIDIVKETVKILKYVKRQGIRVYVIPGSHDYSPSGKTMIDVLEEAELLMNVFKGTVDEKGNLVLKGHFDEKTKTYLAGILGKRGMLDKHYYQDLDAQAMKESEAWKKAEHKIFMFHTAISELKPQELEAMESNPVSMLPAGFDYYAGGHVHIVKDTSLEGYPHIIYPGPVFPANYSELEKLGCGSMYLFEDEPVKKKIEIVPVLRIKLDAEGKVPEEIIGDALKHDAEENQIVLVSIAGEMREGKSSEVSIRKIQEHYKEAYAVLVNKSRLTTKEFEEISVEHDSPDKIEEEAIKQNIGRVRVDFDEVQVMKQLIKALSLEKQEGERVADYQSKIKGMAKEILRI